MVKRIKLFFKQLKCKHDMQLKKWHYVHFPDYQPAHIEAEYICSKCNKVEYLHLYGKDMKQWEMAMGNYKKE